MTGAMRCVFIPNQTIESEGIFVYKIGFSLSLNLGQDTNLKVTSFVKHFAVKNLPEFDIESYNYNQDGILVFKGCLSENKQTINVKIKNFVQKNCGVIAINIGPEETQTQVKMSSIGFLNKNMVEEEEFQMKFDLFSPQAFLDSDKKILIFSILQPINKQLTTTPYEYKIQIYRDEPLALTIELPNSKNFETCKIIFTGYGQESTGNIQLSDFFSYKALLVQDWEKVRLLRFILCW